MFWTLDKILKGAGKHGASDVHLIRGIAPAFRVNGEIRVGEGEALDEPAARHDRRTDEREASRDLRENGSSVFRGTGKESDGFARVSTCTPVSPRWRSVFARLRSAVVSTSGCPP